jgi:hypothetical protein
MKNLPPCDDSPEALELGLHTDKPRSETLSLSVLLNGKGKMLSNAFMGKVAAM